MIPREILKKIRQIEIRPNRIVTETLAGISLLGLLLLLCSCATTSQSSVVVRAAELPAEAILNRGAGRGDFLYVTLHLQDGEDLQFLVDTGSPYTALEKSLESKLGKRLGSAEIPAPWYGSKLDLRGYRSPRLYLGNTCLLMGDRVLAGDFQIWDGPHVSGILGMDCLRHYCVQLDFATGKIQLLDPDNLKTDELGKAFPLTFSKEGYVNIRGTLEGIEDAVSEIDTGTPSDGALEKKLFQQELQKQKVAVAKEYKTSTGKTGSEARFPNAMFAGGNYTNLTLNESPVGNIIGLGFLARHLVTLDFPKRTMFLKQTSIGPLVDENMEAALEFMRDMKEKGKVPGWPQNEKGMIFPEAYSDSGPINFSARRFGDSSTYHYTVSRPSKDSPWKLERAWRTGQNGNTIEEYSVP